MNLKINKIRQFTLLALILNYGCGNGEPKSIQPDFEELETTENQDTSQEAETGIILFFGNSLTAGYGVRTEESFPAIIQERIDQLDLPYEIVNAGVSGETTAAGLNRIDWVLDKYDPDIFVLELGANDGLRGLPPNETKENLKAIIQKVRNTEEDVRIVLAGMMVPPSMGSEYGKAYNRIYGEIAEEENVELIPFLLQDVGGIDSLNQADGIHPNFEGNRIVADNVWKVLGPMIKE